MHGNAMKLALAVTLGLLSSAALGWEPMEIENGHIRVESSISGVKGYSIIDTGAEMNAINSIFLRANDLTFDRGNLKVRVGGVFGEDTRKTFRKVPVTLWGTEIPFRDLIDLNLHDKDLQMLLGAGFLANFVFQFDYPNKRMRVFPRDALNLKKLKNVDSKRDPAGGSPLVRVKLDGRAVWLGIDTGNSSGIIVDRSIALREKWLEKYNNQTGIAYGAVSGGEKITFNLDSLEIGPFELGNIMVSIPPKGKTWNMFKRESKTGSNIRQQRGKSRGLLGYDVLKHFVVTIDYKSGYVHIGPPEDP